MRLDDEKVFRMRIDLEISDKKLGGLSPSDRYRIRQVVADAMLNAGRKTLYAQLGMTPALDRPIIEGELIAPALEHHGTPA